MSVTTGQRTQTRVPDAEHVPALGTRITPAAARVFAVTRIALGWVFLWAFVDKLLGLGFATPAERAWVNGGSPTTGFLSNLEGTFAAQFGALAGQAWADWLFMLGLLGIGVALILGVGLRIAAASGALLLVLMWAAQLPLANNPVIDDHIVYALALAGLALANAGDTWGLGKVWARSVIVRRLPALR